MKVKFSVGELRIF